MRVWTARPSVAEGQNWIVECDGRVMAMFAKKDEADARFIVDACNRHEPDDTLIIDPGLIATEHSGGTVFSAPRKPAR